MIERVVGAIVSFRRRFYGTTVLAFCGVTSGNRLLVGFSHVPLLFKTDRSLAKLSASLCIAAVASLSAYPTVRRETSL
jgi:hypothetical protein